MTLTAADNFNAHVDRILWPVIQHGVAVPRTPRSVQEARLFQRELSGIQAQLKTVKKDVNLYKKQIRLSFGNAQTNASNHPVLALFAGKKNANHRRAQDRQHLREREHAALLPYEGIIDRIDRSIQWLDSMKLGIDHAIQRGQIK